jgi:hypothetical protein
MELERSATYAPSPLDGAYAAVYPLATCYVAHTVSGTKARMSIVRAHYCS